MTAESCWRSLLYVVTPLSPLISCHLSTIRHKTKAKMPPKILEKQPTNCNETNLAQKDIRLDNTLGDTNIIHTIFAYTVVKHEKIEAALWTKLVFCHL